MKKEYENLKFAAPEGEDLTKINADIDFAVRNTRSGTDMRVLMHVAAAAVWMRTDRSPVDAILLLTVRVRVCRSRRLRPPPRSRRPRSRR